MVELTKEEYNIIAKSIIESIKGIIESQKMSTKELLNTLNRYDSRRKVKNEKDRTRKNCQNTEYFKKWIKLSQWAAKKINRWSKRDRYIEKN